MSKNQRGFTMVELIMVIAILGILAATALPRFLDLRNEAQESVFKATVAAIETADRINALAWKASSGKKGLRTAGRDCAEVIKYFLNGSAPAGYTIGGGIVPAVSSIDPSTPGQTSLGRQYGCDITGDYTDATTPVTITE